MRASIHFGKLGDKTSAVEKNPTVTSSSVRYYIQCIYCNGIHCADRYTFTLRVNALIATIGHKDVDTASMNEQLCSEPSVAVPMLSKQCVGTHEEVLHRQQDLFNFGCEDNWCWSSKYKSKEVRLYGADRRIVCFHPHWSNGTAGVIGTKALNTGPAARHYWEIQVSDRIFGTSMMFGIATRKTRLHVDSFINLIGENSHGWGLSHKGYIWHNGVWKYYCRPFRENEPTKVGVLFDSLQGTLTFFKDGLCLGTAFTGLNKVTEKLYPMVSSTAAKTEIVVSNMRRDFCNLQERCKEVIVSRIKDRSEINALRVPQRIENFLKSESDLHDSESEMELDELSSKENGKVRIINYNSLANICGISGAGAVREHSQQPPCLEL
ncbi:SPRY domain-containing SOCS box protein 3-like protein [Dinothrombium tinctorium]|uniref:SPRY domain-containing SOCS box protein 3-like protein n=1 Tax=Dinothrombium tinctorium TaxID=1965070 RepID=A0A443RQY6_9ACAR|nr:SPRY domain-containing SOCS box protein 3-like protein [Dinothrombium tinctorium]